MLSIRCLYNVCKRWHYIYKPQVNLYWVTLVNFKMKLENAIKENNRDLTFTRWQRRPSWQRDVMLRLEGREGACRSVADRNCPVRGNRINKNLGDGAWASAQSPLWLDHSIAWHREIWEYTCLSPCFSSFPNTHLAWTRIKFIWTYPLIFLGYYMGKMSTKQNMMEGEKSRTRSFWWRN